MRRATEDIQLIIPIILAGGSGTRLWPLSRQHYPKQLLKLFGERTMLQQTLLRLDGLPNMGDPVVVCNEEHRFMVAEQLQEIGQSQAAILLEPLARNTAPALALAALKAQTMADNPTLLVLAADHVIRDVPLFHQAVTRAVSAAKAGHLVTFGVEPIRPETGYGYIKTRNSDSGRDYYPVQQFTEKPDLATAESYLAQGGYYWNSGMFVFQSQNFLDELVRYAPEVQTAAHAAYQQAVSDLDFVRVEREAFAQAPDISVDYAVMEKSDKVVCVPFTAGWSDVGCWRS